MTEAIVNINSEHTILKKRKGVQLVLFQSFRFRLIMSVTLVHIILMGIFVMGIAKEQSDGYRAQLYSQGRALSTLMAVASTNALLTEDLATLEEVINRIKGQPDVIYSDVINAHGYVLASTEEARLGQSHEGGMTVSETFPLKAGDQELDIREDIIIRGRKIGTVLLGLSTNRLQTALAHSRNEAIIFILMALVIGGVVAFFLSQVITRNLRNLTSAAGKISAGDLSARVQVLSRDEVGLLARAFNSMGETLQRTSLQVQREYKRRTDAERLACVGEISASIAHEIRNPLSAIINSVKLLGGNELSDKDHEEITSIVNTESLRLQRILNDFLQFARIPVSKLESNNLCKLIDDIIILLKQDANWNENIRIDWPGLSKHECYYYYDKDHMSQVFWNLLQNAVHAIPESGNIFINVEQIDDYLNVSITDDGVGIPDTLFPKVLKPFVSGKTKGTGLGLSIVQRILMQHGTELTVSSQEGEGTVVSFNVTNDESGLSK